MSKLRIYENGNRYWYDEDERWHRKDGPAIERSNGDKKWWINRELHRKNGPAVERGNGHKEWWINDKLHRENGPAIELNNGHKEWWINGEYLTEEKFNKRA